MKTPHAARRTAYFAVSLLSVAITAVICFRTNQTFLFFDLDGKYVALTAYRRGLQVFSDFGEAFGFQWDLLQGLGSIQFTVNALFFPELWPTVFGDKANSYKSITYLIVTVEMFTACFALGRKLGLGVPSAIAGGYLLLVSTIPFRGYAPFMFMSFAPQFGPTISYTAFALVLFASAGSGSRFRDALLLLGLGTFMTAIALATPTVVSLVLPVFLTYCVFLLLLDRSGRRQRIRILIILAAAFVASTLATFVGGLSVNSAAALAARELADSRAGAHFMSIYFDLRSYGGIHFGSILFVGAFAGSFLSVFSTEPRVRAFASATLAIMSVFFVLGQIAIRHPDFNSVWRGAAPLYYEYFILPIYAVMVVRFIRAGLLGVAACAARLSFLDRMGVREQTWPHWARAASALWAILVFPLSIALLPRAPESADPTALSATPARIEMVSLLEREIGLGATAEFRGRVASMVGVGDHGPFGVRLWQPHRQAFDRLWHNDLMAVGMWYYDIPTLFLYNPLMPPAFFRFTKTFFTEQGDVPSRNIVFMRKINVPMLKLLGVRFVLTDEVLGSPEDARLSSTISGLDNRNFHLFELFGANTRGYSPTELIVEPKWDKAVEALTKHASALDAIAVSDRAIPGPFERVDHSSIVVTGSTLHVTASSPGRALLVLPFEFSNCIVIRNKGPAVQPFRADAILFGFAFDRSLDVEMELRVDLGLQSLCGIRDAMEWRAIR